MRMTPDSPAAPALPMIDIVVGVEQKHIKSRSGEGL